MIQQFRNTYNNNFSENTYLHFLEIINQMHPGKLDFKIAETPIFVPHDFTEKMLNTCDEVINFILDKNFNSITQKSIPKDFFFQSTDNKPQMMVFDFGVCEGEKGNIIPQLIEMQGFPSVFAFQVLIDDLYKNIHAIPENFDSYLNGYTKEKYIQLLREIIIGDDNPEQVILLELFPEKQKTKIDFSCTEKLLGIKTVCLTELTAEDNKLYYNSDKRKIQIKRIFNRVIFDDLSKEKLPANTISLHQEYDVKWIPHPDWYYRISKFLLPFIQNQFVPETYFLHEVKMPLPLDEYVLKPLFSYAGTGVITEIKQEDIDNIKNPEDYILQKKVNYASVIKTPDDAAKCEIRLFYFWHEQWERPIAVHNLARLSKGKMIGTRYNLDKTWVGSSIAYFEKSKSTENIILKS